MNSSRWLYIIPAALLLLVGCASHPKQADTRMVVVTTHAFSDKDSEALIFGTLREHGIIAIGVSHGGSVEVNVAENRAGEARRLISELSARRHQ